MSTTAKPSPGPPGPPGPRTIYTHARNINETSTPKTVAVSYVRPIISLINEVSITETVTVPAA